MTDHLARLLDEEDDRRNPELDEAIEETQRKIREAFRGVGTRRLSEPQQQAKNPDGVSGRKIRESRS